MKMSHVTEVVLSCWKLEAQWDLIGLLLSALNRFKMILFWGLKKIPLLLEIPTLKDHLSRKNSPVLAEARALPSAVEWNR